MTGRVPPAEVRFDFHNAAGEIPAAETANEEFAGEIPRDGERGTEIKRTGEFPHDSLLQLSGEGGGDPVHLVRREPCAE